jgi:hypothetical protein
MIVVREENRISAQELHRELKKMAERGARDFRYYDNACETPRVAKLPPPLEATFYVQETEKGASSHFKLDVTQ